MSRRTQRYNSQMVGNPEADLAPYFAFKEHNSITRRELTEHVPHRDRENCSTQRQLGETVVLDSR